MLSILQGAFSLFLCKYSLIDSNYNCHHRVCFASSTSYMDSSILSHNKTTGKSVTFVSSNEMKIREVKQILGDSLPMQLRFENLELDEPQATPISISQAKCRQAASMCNGPVIVEDTSLCFNALNGLPGPYIKWFYEAVGNEGLAKMLNGFEDKTAYAQCVLSYCSGPGPDKGRNIKTFVGSVDGNIVPPDGPAGFGWDPIFVVSFHFIYDYIYIIYAYIYIVVCGLYCLLY
mmetsp:Transcript_18984/g.19100  ORF Transcript_18984/g.19100 Transcript_18984/m.19100 type:complete len:232 (+) Transcript_18984:97-792(+)